uniref:Uncharacterized protein n=1 Tax=Anguilla anguilla TaxID=7936 RepID=A0A0E9ST32_ANGAN
MFTIECYTASSCDNDDNGVVGWRISFSSACKFKKIAHLRPHKDAH